LIHKLLAISFLLLLFGCATVPPEQNPPKEEPKFVVRTDQDSIEVGKLLFDSRCRKCHDPYKDVGFPVGLHGILKKKSLPVSGKPATPENIAKQIRHPFYEMPEFTDLSDDDILDLIAYLNTL